MAQTYDPEHYTANLWPEHRRYFSCGEVLELKAEEQENGEVKLFAKIAPNQQLIDFNRDGQKLFTSVEIAENFRNSGKAYLSGLGVTDSPASVGTTKLDFFNHQDKVQCSEFINIDFTEQKNDEEKMTRSFFNAIKQFFSSSEQQEEQPNSNNNNNKEDNSMNDKQFAQLIGAVVSLGEKIDNHFSTKAETTPESSQPAEKKDEQVQGVTAEQFNQLLGAVQALDKKFNALSQEQTTVPTGVPTVENENVYSLNGYNINLSKGF
nr:Phage capsid scaffolding protein (GPO) serine peptidase [Haemophilus influenzae]